MNDNFLFGAWLGSLFVLLFHVQFDPDANLVSIASGALIATTSVLVWTQL